MQIFGQNIFGLQPGDENYLYSGEISYVLDRIVKVVFSVTKQQRLGNLSIESTNVLSASGSISTLQGTNPTGLMSFSQTTATRKASLFIE